MAQIGRIGGPLLEENLLRNGVDIAFRNNTSTTQLLYIDVNNRRIGVNLNNPSYELEIFDTSATTNFISDELVLPSLRIEDNEINATVGDINLNAPEAIVLSNLETTDFFASDNAIASKNNVDIELRPNGTGTLEVINNLRVYGDLHATGNITLDGTITFGDTLAQDTVTFDADINSNIVPTTTDTYNLGSATKRWDNLYSLLINGEEITAGGASIGGIDLVKRQEYALYVATNGDDTNVGDHIQGPLASIQAAIAKIPSGTTDFYTIYVFPGTYQEELPLVLPANVTIAGNNLRNTIVVPATGYEDSDVFHMNGQTTVQNLTVKNFYYNSVNNTGYAFRFAPNGAITSRSPYVQNVSVITQGSTTSVDDPRGFNAGDAGRGAYINGAELNSSSFDASMLFHSVTLITPGVDAVTMTNGVRVEWLNSFTYFADRGLYAFNGVSGRTSQDGSTINYGAEIRSIGSANIYGNYGAVADGNNTLMYLISHNFAYIGTGKDVSNDRGLAIQVQETVETNSGKIYYSSTDHTGTFRVGDNFFVDFDKGTTSVDVSTLTANSLSGLVINTGTATTTITSSKLETGNIRVSGNLIQSLTGDLNIVSATDEINLLDNTIINANLDIVGNFSFDGTLSLAGDELADSLRFNVALEQDFNPNQHLTFSLGTFSKRWLAAYLDRIEAGDISIYDNVITSAKSNSDLELRANGTGLIYIPNNATFSNTLTVDGVSEFADVVVQGNINLTDNLTQTGDITVNGTVDVSQNLTVSSTVQFEEILIDDNFITTTTSNANLELRAVDLDSVVSIQEITTLQQNLSVNNIFAQNDVTAVLNLSTDTATIGNIEINDNYIQSTGTDQNLEFLITPLQSLLIPTNDVILNQDLTVTADSETRSITVTGITNHTGSKTQTGNYSIAGELFVKQILVEDNFITTTGLDSDLEFRAFGTGTILIPDNNVIITNDLTLDLTAFIQSANIIGTITHDGNRNQIGDYAQTGDLVITGNIEIDSTAQFTDISFSGNILTTTLANNDLILNADGNGSVIVQRDLEVSNNLSARSITVDGDIIIDQDLDLENIFIPPSIIDIGDNYISTKVSNADLELRANGTGSVVIDSNDVEIDNNLTVNGITNLQDLTVAGTVTHAGNRTQVGEYNQTGNLVVNGSVLITNTAVLDEIEIDQNVLTSTSGNLILTANGTGLVTFSSLQANQNLAADTLTAGNIVINNTLALEMLESSTDIQIFDNVITTTNSNSNLELRTHGTGNINLQDIKFNGDRVTTDSGNITIIANNMVIVSATGALTIPKGLTSERVVAVVVPDTFLDGGSATLVGSTLDGGDALTVFTATNTVYNSGSAILISSGNQGDLRLNTSDNVFEGTNNSTITFGGVYSEDRRTNLIAHPTNNSLNFTINNILVGSVISSGLLMHALQVDSININNATITTTSTNSNLNLSADGTGELVIDNLSIKDNLIKNASTPIILANTGFGYSKLSTTGGAVFPSGTEAERPVSPPQTGDTRFNTDVEVLETWDGNTYISAAGTSATISESEFNDLVLEYTLILG